MSFPPQFLDEIRARVSIVDTVARRVKLIRRGREHTGLCPFHNEKTPSFTVSEDKGFYHCFGCGAHGDVISFEMQANNRPFMEAVELLAGEAGLQMPEQTPEDRERAKKQASLGEVLEKACQFFQNQLQLPAGQAARAYIQDRGLRTETVERFRLGYAPAGNRLRESLAQAGVTEDQLQAAGLIGRSEDGSRVYDYFRDRLIFPIADKKGRIVAFGGRILGDGQPKYLNSPDTALFNKGYTLYGLNWAIESARDQSEILVAEGYMDVIALAQAGFKNAVAPLGTALTEAQIESLWRVCEEPILCFDGDAAGQRAARRAAERSLPLLKAAHSLRFALMPSGKDPDDLIKEKGPGAIKRLLQNAVPLSDILWETVVEGHRLDTPERKAALERDMRDKVKEIADRQVQGHYLSDFKNRYWTLVRGGPSSFGGNKGRFKIGGKAETVTALAPGAGTVRQLLAYLLAYPVEAADFLENFSRLTVPDSALEGLLQEALSFLSANPQEADTLLGHLELKGFRAELQSLATQREFLENKKDVRYPEQEIEGIFLSVEMDALQSELASLVEQLGAQTDNDAREPFVRRIHALHEDQKRIANRQEKIGLASL